MDLPNSYRRLVKIDEGNIGIIPDNGFSDISILGRSILFVLARWSGASQLSFRALNDVLHTIHGSSNLRIWISDIDNESTQRFMEKMGDVPTGSGETYWIKDGQVIGKLNSCRDVDKASIEEQVHHLLEEGTKGTE